MKTCIVVPGGTYKPFILKCCIAVVLVWTVQTLALCIFQASKRTTVTANERWKVFWALESFRSYQFIGRSNQSKVIYFRNAKRESFDRVMQFRKRCFPFTPFVIWESEKHANRLLRSFGWIRAFYERQVEPAVQEDILLTLELYSQGGWYLEEVYECDVVYGACDHPEYSWLRLAQNVSVPMLKVEYRSNALLNSLMKAILEEKMSNYLHRHAGRFVTFVPSDLVTRHDEPSH